MFPTIRFSNQFPKVIGNFKSLCTLYTSMFGHCKPPLSILEVWWRKIGWIGITDLQSHEYSGLPCAIHFQMFTNIVCFANTVSLKSSWLLNFLFLCSLCTVANTENSPLKNWGIRSEISFEVQFSCKKSLHYGNIVSEISSDGPEDYELCW